MSALPPLRSDREHIVWPALPSDEAASIAALLEQFAASERLPRATLEAAQGVQLGVLVAHHARHAPAFRARLEAAGLAAGSLGSVAALRRLKPITRQALQAAGRDFFARQVPEGHLPVNEAVTSGSTGEPVRMRKTAVNRLFWAACTVRDHLWHGRDFAGRLVSVRPTNPELVELDDWGFPVAELFETGPALAMPGTVSLDQQIALIDRFRPDQLLCFPSVLRELAARWAARPEGMTGSIRHVRTVGEMVSGELRERVAASLGIRVQDNYSCQEAGIVALQCPSGEGYHAMAESLVVELLHDDDRPCAEGEIGRVVLTDLHNFAAPVIRYDIGDFAEAGGACTCGRTLPTLRRVLGRRRNLLMKADGSLFLPRAGFETYSEVAPVQQYQVIQHALDAIEFRLVTAEPMSEAQCEALSAILRRSLQFEGRIEVVQSRERLPASKAGKYEDFVCRVPPR